MILNLTITNFSTKQNQPSYASAILENRKADAEELLHYLILSGGNSPLEKTMLSNVFENHDLSVLFKESRMKQKTNTGKFAQKNGKNAKKSYIGLYYVRDKNYELRLL